MEIGVYKALEHTLGVVFQRRDRLGGRAGRRPGDQPAASGCRPRADGVQARASLRRQPGRRRRHGARRHRRRGLLCGIVRPPRAGLRLVHHARGRLRLRAGDRVRHARALLHRARPAQELAGQDDDPLLHLRTQVRARRHGAVSGLFRPDLLALLLARRALPRPLQAGRAPARPDRRRARRGLAALDHGAADLARRPLSQACCRCSC